MIDKSLLRKIDKAESWSVQYQGTPYDDARQVDGRWYYRHIVSGEYREFPSQNHLIPLSKNRPKDP
jgi:hypothetical protein